MRVNNILVLALTTVLFGCASLGDKESKSSFNNAYKIEPTKTSDLIQAENAEQYYQIGRKYQKEGKYDLAIMSFQKALKLENNKKAILKKNYSNSITGLASAYANQKLYFLAIPLFKEVVILDPTPAHFNNLGYAYYLNKQYEEASNALNQALAIDPNYIQARKNLKLVSQNLNENIADEKSSNSEKKSVNSKQEIIIKNEDQVKTHEVLSLDLDKKRLTLNETSNGIYELGHGKSIHKSTDNKAIIISTNPVEKEKQTFLIDKKSLTLNETSNGIYKLEYEKNALKSRDINTTVISDRKVRNNTKTIQVLASGGISLKLMPAINQLFDIGNNMLALFTPSNTDKYIEVINGNGLKGIARTVVKKLEEGGYAKYRVADAKRFNKTKTYIEYKSNFSEDALQLKYSLLNQPVLVKNNNLPNEVMIRLVLGRDLMIKNNNTSESDT